MNKIDLFPPPISRLGHGDLIFLGCDNTPISSAIVATSADAVLPLDHVGILDMECDAAVVIEAQFGRGVVCTPMAEFLQRAPGASGWTARRVPADKVDIRQAVCRARGCVGLDYNSTFRPGRKEALYCSELVQRTFLRLSDGKPYFDSIVMDFEGVDETTARFWCEYFEELGVTAPHGLLGTSPLTIYSGAEPIS